MQAFITKENMPSVLYNNNNMWIYKAHSVSKQAESEAPININVLIIWTN